MAAPIPTIPLRFSLANETTPRNQSSREVRCRSIPSPHDRLQMIIISLIPIARGLYVRDSCATLKSQILNFKFCLSYLPDISESQHEKIIATILVRLPHYVPHT